MTKIETLWSELRELDREIRDLVHQLDKAAIQHMFNEHKLESALREIQDSGAHVAPSAAQAAGGTTQ